MFCYIILHYQVEKETIDCVNQLKLINGNHKIIIIDNCSPNDSGKRLYERYKNDDMVDVILHDKNDGFARGNNAGCQFAKEKYDPDFYVVMNNDVEIQQNDFEKIVEDVFSETSFDVLGPDIYSTTEKKHQSPKSLNRTSIEQAIRLRDIYKKRCNSKVIVPLRYFLKKFKFLKRIKNKLYQRKSHIDSNKAYTNVPLHGSCVIFSKSFMRNREYAFFPGTFFYYEMEILDYECQINGFKEIYDPRLHVLHHQNVSTNATYSNSLKRVHFMNEQNYKSINAFLSNYNGVNS